MAMDVAKKKFLAEHLGQEEADRLEREISKLEKELMERGISFKELVLDQREQGQDSGVVPALKASRHPAARYIEDLFAARIIRNQGS